MRLLSWCWSWLRLICSRFFWSQVVGKSGDRVAAEAGAPVISCYLSPVPFSQSLSLGVHVENPAFPERGHGTFVLAEEGDHPASLARALHQFLQGQYWTQDSTRVLKLIVTPNDFFHFFQPTSPAIVSAITQSNLPVMMDLCSARSPGWKQARGQALQGAGRC